jgi:gas vesicle protein
MENNRSKLIPITSFVVGSLLGAGIALLLAPQSGKRTRRDIVHFGKVARNKAEALQLQVRHSCEDWTDKVLEEVQEGLGRSRQWTEKTQQGVLHALDSAKEYVRKEIRGAMQAQG